MTMSVQNIPFGNAISVEVECYGTVDQRYNPKRDGSLGPGGIEVVFTAERNGTPVSIPNLDAVAGCRVDRWCGLHVHVDVRDLTHPEAASTYRNLLRASRALKNLVPPSRHNNQYCRWRSNLSGYTRYAAINFKAWYKFRTIEFRCQAGSTERSKIEAWAELCYQLVQWAKTAPSGTSLTWRSFLKVLSPEIRTWAVKRYAKLHRPTLGAELDVVLNGQYAGRLTRELRALGADLITTRAAVQPQVAAPRPSRVSILGYSTSQVLRRIGQLGLGPVFARRVLREAGATVQESTVRFMLRSGAEGTTQPIAPLSAEQLARYIATPMEVS